MRNYGGVIVQVGWHPALNLSGAGAHVAAVLYRHWQSPAVASTSHYDICKQMRAKAISFGAIEVSTRQMAAMTCRRRLTGDLGDPGDALAWFWNDRPTRRAASTP